MKTFDPYNLSEHINLNITNLAQKTIDSDRLIFGATSQGALSFGTIVNTIISSYDNDFPLDETLIKKKDYQSYRKLHLNKTAIDTLISYDEDEYPLNGKYTVPQYIKCLLESYARISFLEREKLILKKSTIEPLENAIDRNKLIKFRYDNKIIEIAPYKIVASKEGTFQYLIGMVNGAWESYRLSRIIYTNAKGKAKPFDEDERSKIDEILAEYGPTFSCEPITTVKVKFTPKGLTRYEYSVIHRPIHTEIEIDPKTNSPIHVFKCSEKQALFFFFSYADDAEIVEPLSLREKFAQMYQLGAKSYQKQ